MSEPVLTIFATAKPFHGHTGIIQRNAVASWTLLRPRPEIILFGDEPGTADLCREFGLGHIPELACTELGAPLLPDLFGKAQRTAAHNLLCYVNSDIMLMGDFLEALRGVSEVQKRFLMVGRRWDASIRAPWDFDTRGGENDLRDFVRQHGKQGPPPGNSDFFAFPKGLWSSIPEFSVGRGWWDPWLVYEARRLGAAVVDTSSSVMAVHQNHDQSTYPHGLKSWRREVNHNFELAGRDAATFCLYDATHVLDGSGLRRVRGLRYLSRYIDTLPVIHPALALPLRIPKAVITGVRAVVRSIARSTNPSLRLVNLVQSKLPSDGVTAILGLNEAQPGHGGSYYGMNSASALLMGGYPVIAYDPDSSIMEKARLTLGGPIEFANSAEDCAKEADVIVIASPREEFQAMSAWVLDPKNPRRVVIDCCELWPEPMRPGIDYIAWAERL
jgi:hypothetical protein